MDSLLHLIVAYVENTGAAPVPCTFLVGGRYLTGTIVNFERWMEESRPYLPDLDNLVQYGGGPDPDLPNVHLSGVKVRDADGTAFNRFGPSGTARIQLDHVDAFALGIE